MPCDRGHRSTRDHARLTGADDRQQNCRSKPVQTAYYPIGMTRYFNTAGPCQREDHYMLPAAGRIRRVPELIERKLYFVVHAPRQVGKTTSFRALVRGMVEEQRYTAMLASCEVAQAAGADVERGIAAIVDAIRQAGIVQLSPALRPPLADPAVPAETRLKDLLARWARQSPKPVVLFLDEIDALVDSVLISVLRQIRSGYDDRPTDFPQSVALIGMRDVRDYKVASGGGRELHTASPFNVKDESLTLHNFTRDEVAELLGQHTGDTGQEFESPAIDRVHDLTDGQPWLVNALARQLVEHVVPDRATCIEVADVERAKGIVIERQDTHLDSLAERLREDRVRRVLEPILASQVPADLAPDDIRYSIDLGLVRENATGGLEIGNPIYREVIPFALSGTARAYLPALQPTWLTPEGTLDAAALLDAFLTFWRQHGEPLMRSAPYHEIAPHLVMMAFLHRVVNGGGSLEREYAVGSGRMDVCLRHGHSTLGIELKVWRDGQSDPLTVGLAQIDRYLAGLGLDSGWLVVFDRRSGQAPLAERTTMGPERTPGGRTVVVVRA